MKKGLLIIAAAGMVISSCSNESELPINGKNAVVDKNAVVITINKATTREEMNSDLIHAWNTSDVMGVFSNYDNAGTLTANGSPNATFTFHSTYTTAYQSFTNVFTQSDTPAVKWQASDKIHNFWMYSPRDANATTTSNVSFALASTQIQTTPNVWSNPTTTAGEYQGYNFIWSNISNAYQPYDRSIPFTAKRLLPVAEFNIIRDDASLDGYYLTRITLVPSSGTMATGTVTAGTVTNKIDLTALSSCNTLSFSATAAKYTLDTKGTGNGIQIADANVTANHGFSVYMGVPPATEQEYKVWATFTNGTITKYVSVTRSDAYTITNGKGNLIRYYLKSSASFDVNEGFDGKYYAWDEVLKTTAGGAAGTGYNGYLEYMQDYNSTDATDQLTTKLSYNTIATGVATNVCKDCPTYDQIRMYLGAGVYYGDGPDGYIYTASSTRTATKGLWVMKKQYIAGFDAGTAQKVTLTTPNSGQPSDLSKYFFLPAAGDYYQGALLPTVGSIGAYPSSTPDNGNDVKKAYYLQFKVSEAGTQSYAIGELGLPIWRVQ